VTELSILVPVLRRPQNAQPLVDSIVEATEGVDFQIVFISTAGDLEQHRAVDVQRARDDVNIRHLTMQPCGVGDYAKKINHGFASTASDWVFLAADDLRFHPGWFPAAETAATLSGKRVVGTQDLGNSRVLRGEHSTHTLVHRTYVDEYGTIDEPGKILHEGYPHEFVDDECIETAKARDEFVFAHDSIVEHLHPLWGKAPTDRIYDAHRKRMNQGRRIYIKRKRLWT
jgi:glycosyltransferase involved in cell wall biosynthesis